MNTNGLNNFSFERVIHLCQRYIAIKKSMIISGGFISIGLVSIIYLVMVLLMPEVIKQNEVYNVMGIGITIFTFMGYALSSTMFDELNSEGSATMYFTLPASALEKLLSALCLSYFCYSLVGLLILYIISLMLGVTNGDFLSMKTLDSLLLYTFFHSVFIFGAAYFKANNFLSTVVALLACSVLISLAIFLLGRVAFFQEPWFMKMTFGIGEQSIVGEIMTKVFKTLLGSSFFIWLAFRRLKNRQLA